MDSILEPVVTSEEVPVVTSEEVPVVTSEEVPITSVEEPIEEPIEEPVYAPYVKEGCSLLEAELQQNASNYGFAPRVYSYESAGGRLAMQHLNEMCLADMYGTNPADIPANIWEQIHTIIETLYIKENIEYIDITGYNFVEKGGKVYIIDFGHAYYRNEEKGQNWFHKEFMEGSNTWNSDFA